MPASSLIPASSAASLRRMVAAGLLLMVAACNNDTSILPPPGSTPRTTASPAAATVPAPPYVIRFETADMTIKGQKYTIEIADTDEKIQRGLMYRASLADDRGMLFTMPSVDYHSFWMKNTYIPLDIIYIDAKGVVVDIHNRKPHDETGMSPVKPALYVLELSAGRSKAIGLKIGDTLAIPEKFLKKSPATSDK